ncbi:hypothetical protein IAG44_20625 [Streptomyces roseirectus]|uniref:Uncharacterized protein n=1 Tax=Streptomyces roseirectus TaxID=2768066 RepID=A0A7H0ISV8_9ACTN|nr:hypothetical protein IAG44_20625 [Streptomyces roseirectus]
MRGLARGSVVGVVVGGVLAGPGGVARAADVPAYAYDRGARVVNAASGTSDAERLEAGGVYRSSLVGRGKAYFRVDLDASSTTYVSVTAIPGAEEELAFSDGVKVFLQDDNGLNCSNDAVTFGSVVSPHPVTAWGVREIRAGRSVCQGAGAYYVVVERAGEGTSGSGASGSAGPFSGESPTGSESGSGSDGSESWGLELAVVSEPPVGKGGATEAPEGWSSATPAPVEGEARRRPGGAGFGTATDLEQGVWRDDVLPGQTVYYSVPVGWGQQVFVNAELGSADGGSGFVASALDVTLYNPVRAKVDDLRFGYDGEQKTGALRVLPPVDHANRYSSSAAVGGMRFAGEYYLAVHLSRDVAERFGDGAYGVTLRVRVSGVARTGPGYRGEPVPAGVFGGRAGSTGTTGTGAGAGAGGAGGSGTVSGETRAGTTGTGGGAMVAVAVGGFGVGTLVLVVLGVWFLVGRRAQARVRAQKPMA